jgi:hypothetical protein
MCLRLLVALLEIWIRHGQHRVRLYSSSMCTRGRWVSGCQTQGEHIVRRAAASAAGCAALEDAHLGRHHMHGWHPA